MPTSSENLIVLLEKKLGVQLESVALNLGHPEIYLTRQHFLSIMQLLKADTDFRFDLFLSVTAVDWMDRRINRFELIYHLLSVHFNHRLRIKVPIEEANPEIETVSLLWPGANFMEREVFDMYGIRFLGHPDLRRILMYDEFNGFPLRKDYPVQAKQPRINLRHPEVRNTAVDMNRESLISIRSKKKAA